MLKTKQSVIERTRPTISPTDYIVYELVNAEVVDGLVSWASSVGGTLERDEIARFHCRYHPLPIVSTTLPMEGIPTVLIDSYQGMRDVIAHLIEFHVSMPE